MRRLMLGSLAAGLAMWVVGFLFWGPLLGWIPFSQLSDGNAATLQTAMKATLGATGTGTYLVPSPATTIGTQLHAQGPVAIVHFTNMGFPGFDTTAMLGGLALAIVCAFVLALALQAVATNLFFIDRVKVVGFVAVAIAGYSDLGQPIFNHTPWGYFIYLFVSDVVTWVAAGAILSRWFLPEAGAA